MHKPALTGGPRLNPLAAAVSISTAEEMSDGCS